MAYRLRQSWRSSHLPTSLWSQQSSLPCTGTALTHTTRMAITLSRTTPYVLAMVQSRASATLDVLMLRVWCSFDVRYTSIQTPSRHVACAFSWIDLFPTHIFGVSFRWRCFLWPRLCMNISASVFAVSNCSLCLLADSMLFAAHHSRTERTWLTLLPVATEPGWPIKDSLWACDTYSSTQLTCPEV